MTETGAAGLEGEALRPALPGSVTGMRETLAMRAGRPVSPQKTRPMTTPLGSGAGVPGVMVVVWAWAAAVARSRVQRGREARTSLVSFEEAVWNWTTGDEVRQMRFHGGWWRAKWSDLYSFVREGTAR